MAAELEFYLFNQTFDEARAGKYENLKFSSWYPEDGHIFQTTKDEPYIRAIRTLMEKADIPVRVLGQGPSLRFECRVPGTDANPYLAFAALIASGLAGIENRLELASAHVGDAYGAAEVARIPRRLDRALLYLETSEALRAGFGDSVIAHYLHCSRWELNAFEVAVTDWERLRLFERC